MLVVDIKIMFQEMGWVGRERGPWRAISPDTSEKGRAKKIKREDGGGGTKFHTFAAGGKVGEGNKLRQRRWYEGGGRERRMVGIEGERGPLEFWRKSPR